MLTCKNIFERDIILFESRVLQSASVILFNQILVISVVFKISGGPLVAYLEEERRSVLVGSVHGAFEDCSNDLPGLYVETDDLSILEFIQKEVFGQGNQLFYQQLYLDTAQSALQTPLR